MKAMDEITELAEKARTAGKDTGLSSGHGQGPSAASATPRDRGFRVRRSIGNQGMMRLMEPDQEVSITEEAADEVRPLARAVHGEGISRLPDPVIQREGEEGSAEEETTDLEELAMHRYRGCSGDDNFYLDLAQSRAPNWVYSTIADLRAILAPHETITAAEMTLNRFFHPPAGGTHTIGGRHRAETIQTIIRRLERMGRDLENARLFRCVSRRICAREVNDPDAYAYAAPGIPVSICPNFFTLSLTDQVSTLIHETAHHIGLMRNVIPRERVIDLPLGQALNNAESYALLVIENIMGPPLAPPPAPPAPPEALTSNWSPAYMRSEFVLESPVSGLFYEGRGERNLLSAGNRSFSVPFPSSRPFRFRGQVRFYMDSEDMPMPANTPLAEVSTQVQFVGRDTGTMRTYFEHLEARPTEYLGPELPLLVPFSPDFDFTIRENGTLRFIFWMGGMNFYATYDDTVTVVPNNDI